jgi:hypothetical protein
MMEARSPFAATLPPLMQTGGELSADAIAALCGHPQFPDAMRAMLSDNVRLYRGNRILNYVGSPRSCCSSRKARRRAPRWRAKRAASAATL